jgi:hypothetical protein
MTSRLMNWIENRESGCLLWGTDQEVHTLPDSTEWFSWLATLTSFHFSSKHGGHFTARREQRARGEDGYWYAYRKASKRQYRHYLGTTQKLTLAHLEQTAAQIEQEVLRSPQLKKGKRAPVRETKEDLRQQIKERNQEIEKLKRQIEEQGLTIIRQNNEILALRQQLRQKR